MKNVLITDPIHEKGKTMLSEKNFHLEDISSKKETIKDKIKNADIIIIRSATKVNKELLENAPNLKIIARCGAGLDNVNLDECKKRNITVLNSPEGPTRSVAELVIGLIITVSRKLSIVNSETKLGEWPKKKKGQELFGKTIGIIGTGAIGKTVAKYCLVFGMKVLAYDIVKNKDLEELAGFKYVDLDTLFKNSDIITLHVPLFPTTKHMIGKKQFDIMKKGTIIVNAARGGLINESDLINAIHDKIISGAALDVYESEPVSKQNPLLRLENVITTAHIGAQTYEASEKNTTIVCQKIINYYDKTA